MIDNAEWMNMAVDLARSGEHDGARRLFTRIIAEEPGNYQAWLWLSELAQNLEDQLAMLEQAVQVAPPNADGCLDLQAHLNEIRGCMVLNEPVPAAGAAQAAVLINKRGPRETVEQAERWVILGRRAEARQLLTEQAESGTMDEQAWQLLSELSPDPAQKIRALENRIRANPENAGANGTNAAAALLQAFQTRCQDPMQLGRYLEDLSEPEQALELYQWIADHAESARDQVEARQRITCLERSRDAAGPLAPKKNPYSAAFQWVSALFR
jgi:tetratricopeptide (TPR) repeat protein